MQANPLSWLRYAKGAWPLRHGNDQAPPLAKWYRRKQRSVGMAVICALRLMAAVCVRHGVVKSLKVRARLSSHLKARFPVHVMAIEAARAGSAEKSEVASAQKHCFH